MIKSSCYLPMNLSKCLQIFPYFMESSEESSQILAQWEYNILIMVQSTWSYFVWPWAMGFHHFRSRHCSPCFCLVRVILEFHYDARVLLVCCMLKLYLVLTQISGSRYIYLSPYITINKNTFVQGTHELHKETESIQLPVRNLPMNENWNPRKRT